MSYLFINQAQFDIKHTLELPQPGCACVSFRPDGKIFASAGWDHWYINIVTNNVTNIVTSIVTNIRDVHVFHFDRMEKSLQVPDGIIGI